ncbi:MAG: hypothetical protein ABJQ29_11600 [Luteolibacter sp.]
MNSGAAVKKRQAPWVVGMRAAKANLIPGLIVQGIMLALLLSYYFYPPTTRWLNQLADLKGEFGYGYTLVASIIAGALIPEIMRIIVFQKGRIFRRNFENLLFTIPFWGISGMIVDLFYRYQEHWFGAEVTFQVVLAKVLVDQFLYNPLFAAPSGACLYDWKNSGYRLKVIPQFFTVAYYRNAIIPVLFATWGVWIPLVTIIYCLPSLLQIPLFALALSLWVMLFTWINEQRAEKSA